MRAYRPGHTSTLGHPATRQRSQRMAGFVFSGQSSGVSTPSAKEQRAGHGAAVNRSRRAGRDRDGRPAVHVAAGAASVVQAGVAGGERAVGRQGLRRRGAVAAGGADARRRRDPHRRRLRARPRPEDRLLRARREGGRRARGAVRRRRPRRAQQRPQLPDGSAGAAADPRGQRRPPRACWPSSGRPRAGPARSSPIPTARRSCWRWRWRRCASSASRAVVVTTMQAVSGAGYPGVPSLDILGNIVPFIGGEEEKIESETQKILGGDGGRAPHPVRDQRAHQPRAGDRRPHHDRVGRVSSRARRRPTWSRRCARSAAGRRSWTCRPRPTRPSW